MIVYGKNVIKEAVLNKREFYKFYVDIKFSDKKFLNFLNNHNMRYQFVSKDKLFEICQTKNHQGIVADVRPYQEYDLNEVLKENKYSKFLILDQISDPHNLGSIIRTANACGIDGIIISKRNQVKVNATVAKTSAGAVEYERIIMVSNINNAIKKLKDNNFKIVGTSDKADQDYKVINTIDKIALVLGNEGTGMRHLVSENCDLLVRIPMKGKISSLNVGVAGALLMYEMIKQ